ncbi:MAG: anti-sigma factor antagonist [Candidatus Omnitrophica bacterium]|nr:anti-sigma factor antagonist [Candidatus Omnitrophota bacterium]
MEIKGRTKGKIIILDLGGRIDVNAANLIEAVGQCLHDGYIDILCNFEEVDFIDYMGISVLSIAYKEVINSKGRMKFVNMPTHLRNLFSVTGLDKVIEFYADENLAVNSFKEDRIIENIQKMQLRRRFKRLPIDIKIELKRKYDKEEFCLKTDLLDLSALGAYIYGCDKYKLGDEVIITFNLPPKSEELKLDAKVVWLSDKNIQHHIHPGMGVEFHNISTAEQKRLVEFIERNLSLI